MRNTLTIFILSALTASAFAATAGTPYLVVPLPGYAQSESSVAVELTGGALPKASKGSPYSVALNNYLRIKGDPQADATQVLWEDQSAVPVDWLSVGGDGMVTGRPTTKGVHSLQVKATYKGKEGSQTYSIEVGGELLQVSSLSMGFAHTCAVTTAGGAKCWGRNADGQLGDGTTESSSTPKDVPGLASGVVSIVAGRVFSCASTNTDRTYCWGSNANGEFGSGTTSSLLPKQVSRSFESIAVKAGQSHACAQTTSGGAKCWGENNFGQLGDGTKVARSMPRDVTGLTTGVKHLDSKTQFSCAVTVAGTVKCWGANHFGQLGYVGAESSTPVLVAGLSDVKMVAVGDTHACALTNGGRVLCWGAVSTLELGAATTTPVEVPLLSPARLISSTRNTACAALSDGVVCWGSNVNGQLGSNGATGDLGLRRVVGLGNEVTSLVSGAEATCAITSKLSARCWGNNNNGQLGQDLPFSLSAPGDELQLD